MSTILQLLYGAYDQSADVNNPDALDELREHAGEFLDASLADQLGDVLAQHDPNGLRPTANAMELLLAVIRSIDFTDEQWDGTGQPQYVRYALDAEQKLRLSRKGR